MVCFVEIVPEVKNGAEQFWKKLWIADETGGFEELRPGPGYNGRTRGQGEPDWWVVAKDPDWGRDLGERLNTIKNKVYQKR